MSTSIPIFSKQYIENTSSSKNQTMSPVIQVEGNRCVLNATIRNISVNAGMKVSISLEGSYDRRAWEGAGAAIEFELFGNNDVGIGSSGGSFDYPYVRVSAQMKSASATANIAILDANLVFSKQ